MDSSNRVGASKCIERLVDKKHPWPDSASEPCRPSDGHFSAKLAPTFADKKCYVICVTDDYDLMLCFLDRSRYLFFLVAPQLYSRG
jgi:hypothetical protein